MIPRGTPICRVDRFGTAPAVGRSVPSAGTPIGSVVVVHVLRTILRPGWIVLGVVVIAFAAACFMLLVLPRSSLFLFSALWMILSSSATDTFRL